MRIRVSFLLIVLCVAAPLEAQKSFNPHNVLIISKEGEKRPGFMRTGTGVKCKLQNGQKLKGILYVYGDHIMIDDVEVDFMEIKEIKKASFNRVVNSIRDRAFNTYMRSNTGRLDFNGYFWVRAGLSTLFMVSRMGKSYKNGDGWEFRIEDFSSYFSSINARR